MIYFKIALGVIMAFVACIIPVLFYTIANMEDHPPLSNTTFVLAFAAALFVFLSSLFTADARKKAAITALIICCILDTQGLIMLISGKHLYASAIEGLAVFLVAAATGLLISYLVFKNKGWNSSVNP